MSDFDGFSEFTVGSVIGRAWTVMWRKPMAFFTITLLSTIISFIMGGMLTFILVKLFSWFNMPPGVSFLTAGIGGGFSFLIVSAIFQGALIYVIFMLLLHGQASIGEAFQRSTSRVLTIILASVIMGLAVGLIFFVPAILAAFLGAVVPGNFSALLVIVFTIAAMVFGVIFVIKWSVFAPACVIERTGATASLSRSSDLTEGFRGKIFAIFLLVGILVGIFNAIAGFFNNKIFGAGILGSIFSAILSTPPLTFFSVLPAVIYFSLRVAKESLAPESLADIFD